MRPPQEGRSIHELSRDYAEAAAQAAARGLEVARLEGYRRFVERNAHRLGPHPGALVAVAHAEPQDSVVRRDALEWEGRRGGRPWLRRVHCPETDRYPGLIRTIDVGSSVNAVVLAVGGKPHALSGSDDGTLRWWDLHSGQCLAVLQGHDSPVWAVALSSDGRHALSGSSDRTLRYWDLHSKQCLAVLEGHQHPVYAVALSSDGSRALSGSADRTLRYWDLHSGQCLAVLKGHEDGVSAVALSNDGSHALSGSRDRTLHFWDLDSGQCLAVLKGHEGWVNALALSGDGSHALSGSWDATLRWWDLPSGQCLAVLKRHEGRVNAVALSSDGRHALSGPIDGTLRYWDLHSGQCLASYPCEASVASLAYRPGPFCDVVLGLGDGQVQFFKLHLP
jgi:hypothetical protein